MNLYRLLGVRENASEHEIRAAYRRIALLCHPDRTKGDPEAESLFHEATEAYRILTHPDRKRQYEIEYGLVESVVDIFERKRIGKQLMKSILPTAKNAPRAGRTWVRVMAGPLREPGQPMKMQISSGSGRTPIRIGEPPDGLEFAWYELAGHGEPGRNGGEPGALWLMITDKGEANGT
jgi:curved DNA-binding protein CbpA